MDSHLLKCVNFSLHIHQCALYAPNEFINWRLCGRWENLGKRSIAAGTTWHQMSPPWTFLSRIICYYLQLCTIEEAGFSYAGMAHVCSLQRLCSKGQISIYGILLLCCCCCWYCFCFCCCCYYYYFYYYYYYHYHYHHWIIIIIIIIIINGIKCSSRSIVVVV